MSNQLENKTRRTFLKSATYVSVLTVGGLSGLAFANKDTTSADNVVLNSNADIKVIQKTLTDREQVTLINQSGKLQMLDARQPISLHQVTGKLLVTVNQNADKAVNGMVLMSPNERFSFDVKAIGLELENTSKIPVLTNLAENQLQIVSGHSVFNRIVPVQLV